MLTVGLPLLKDKREKSLRQARCKEMDLIKRTWELARDKVATQQLIKEFQALMARLKNMLLQVTQGQAGTLEE